MHFLITGHTGFKGAWLTLLLKNLGHTVSGVALNPEKSSLFEIAELNKLLNFDERLDIRDSNELKRAFEKIDPEMVIHLAAQPLVRLSYENPRETFETNVNGTFNVLESLKNLSDLQATLIITTDKVYKNINSKKLYIESDPLGGDDPYSASKAMADLMTQSYIKSFDLQKIAIARAGNVIGGGDFSKDRLVPDLLRGFAENKPVKIRYPQAVRPWQHVLDCLNGYYELIMQVKINNYSGAWNFGPEIESFKTVTDVAEFISKSWSANASWEKVVGQNWPEAELLMLNSNKAQENLGWRNKLDFTQTLEWTVDWQKEVLNGDSPLQVSTNQIEKFLSI